jgi:cardiolipin synthase
MSNKTPYQWLTTGDDFFATVEADIGRAKDSIRLEMYIYTAGQPGDAIRNALCAAARRGVTVRILLDAFGSLELPSDYWHSVAAAGGIVRFFNPLTLGRIAFRDHRKLLVCDGTSAIISGFNISRHELGDGITGGWRDLGLKLTSPLAGDLAESFDRMFRMADFKHRRLHRIPWRPPFRRCPPGHLCPSLLTSGPGQNGSAIKATLLHDLQQARTIRIISAYFLPPRPIRRALIRAARRGRDVTLITAGKTDVKLARFAGRALYHRLLRAGIRIAEYDAQILHTKLIIADHVVYVGSANLDTRSLNINYECLVRIDDRRLADEAHQIFNDHLAHCQSINRSTWPRTRPLWEKFMERVSHFILARVDILFARRQLGKLR